ncbi:MAG: hypothetical protein RL642_743, partial [Bacteroidota bacterium]
MQLKKIIIIFSISTFIACSASNKITYSWTNPNFTATQPYHKLFLAALVNNPHVRTHLEEEMWLTAKANGLEAERSWDYFPPSFSKPTPPSREMMMKEINRLNCDLIFTITLTDKKSETRYIPGVYGLYGPFPGYGLQFRGFYSYWYPYAYDPGYYVTDRTYFMEGNLFDTKTETLIWSIQ